MAGQKQSLPVPPALAVQRRGHLIGTRCPCNRGHAMSEATQHEEPTEWCETGSVDSVPHLGLVPESSSLRPSKAEQPVKRFIFPLVWQRYHWFCSTGRLSGTLDGSCCGDVSYSAARSLVCWFHGPEIHQGERGASLC